MSIRQKLFDSYLDALKLQLKLKSVLGTLDEQSLVAVDGFPQSNAAAARAWSDGCRVSPVAAHPPWEAAARPCPPARARARPARAAPAS